MIFTTSIALLSLSALVAAQYGPAGSSSPSSSAAASAPSAPANTPGHINIDVALNSALTFSEANITASNGTVVTYYFSDAGAHSVTQSSFSAPCTYLAANGSDGPGFDSGLQQAVQFSINITNDQEPIWYHCKQVGHCGMGMVGAINAPATGNTFAAFQNAAKAIGASEQTETDHGPVTGGVNAIATATPAASASGSSGSSSSSGAGRFVDGGALGLVSAVLAMVMA